MVTPAMAGEGAGEGGMGSSSRNQRPSPILGGLMMALGATTTVWTALLSLQGNLECLGGVLLFGPMMVVAGWKTARGTFGQFPARRGW